MLHKWDGYDEWERVEAQVRALEEEAYVAGDAITMRDHSDASAYQDAGGDEEVEVDVNFESRRAHLIEHFNYLHSQRYNVNRIR